MADLSVTAANVAASTTAVIKKEYTFGATVTAGQLVYLDTSNKWQLVDANAAATGNNVGDTRGIALNGGANNQPAAVCIEDTSGFAPGATVAAGVTYYSSNNAGAITADVPVTAVYPTVVGIGKNATHIVLKPFAAGVAVG